MAIQARRGFEADFIPENLLPGEPATTLDTKRAFMGNGEGALELATRDQLSQTDAQLNSLRIPHQITIVGVLDIIVTRVGNTVTLSVDGIMNKIPNAAAWNSATIGTLPVGYRPPYTLNFALTCDGPNSDYAKGYGASVRPNGNVCIDARANAIAWSGYTVGNGVRFSTSFVTLDPLPTA